MFLSLCARGTSLPSFMAGGGLAPSNLRALPGWPVPPAAGACHLHVCVLADCVPSGPAPGLSTHSPVPGLPSLPHPAGTWHSTSLLWLFYISMLRLLWLPQVALKWQWFIFRLWRSGVQADLTRLKSRCELASSPKAGRFPYPFWILEAPAILCSWPPSIFRASHGWCRLSHALSLSSSAQGCPNSATSWGT